MASFFVELETARGSWLAQEQAEYPCWNDAYDEALRVCTEILAEDIRKGVGAPAVTVHVWELGAVRRRSIHLSASVLHQSSQVPSVQSQRESSG